MVLIVCIVAVCILVMVLICKSREEDNEVASGCLTQLVSICATIGIIFFLFVVYGIVNVFLFLRADSKWNDRSNMSAEDKTRWSYYVALPEAEPCFEYYSIRGAIDPRYMVETREYKNVEEMCEDLPEGCEDAISEALSSESKEDEDTRGEDIKQYKVEKDLLPLLSDEEIESKYGAYAYAGHREYYVNEYEDGTYRFILCYQKT